MSRRFGAWLVLVLGAASCFPVLDEYGLVQGEQATPCASDANCEDNNPCTIDTCQPDKTCVRVNAADGPLAQQIAGDCRRDDCVAGQVVETNDVADIPDDSEPCTTDSCNEGMAVHTSLPDDSMCTKGSSPGKCAMGVCTVECNAQKPCDDQRPCTQDTCNVSTGKCAFSPLDGLPTPGVAQVGGDCKQQICIAGIDTALEDNADVLDDDNSCTKDSCVNGVPVQKLDAEGTFCIAGGIMGVCNAIGGCEQCNVPSDCPAIVPANPCKRRMCTNNVCGAENLPAMDLPAAADGDCKKPKCDGNGNLVMMNDNNDVPIDGNPCTQDVCINGTPSNPPEPNTAKCGPTLMQMCDGMGQCTGCMSPTDCGVTDDCKTYSCLMSKCAILYTVNGTKLPNNKQTDGDCQVLQCDGAGNTIAAIDPTDAPPDNNACTQNLCDMMGMPTYPPEPLNTMCAAQGGTLCDGLGHCLKAPGAGCANGTECVTGFCTDGVCCTDACTAGCMACNVSGLAGTCTNVPATGDDAPLCSGTNSCDGMGACKRDNGQACSESTQCASGFCVDGYCCNTGCMGTCKTCARSGYLGTCVDMPNTIQDPNASMPCTAPNQCDGSGNCKAVNGYACTMASQCLSGYCVDGFCCGNICNQTCMACSMALNGVANGSCQPIPNGTDPENECPANRTCNGTGMCSP